MRMLWKLVLLATCTVVGTLVAAELDCDGPNIDEDSHNPPRRKAESTGCTWDVKAIPRVKQADLSVEAFVRTYLRPGRPVIIEMGTEPVGPAMPVPWLWDDIINTCFDNAEVSRTIRECIAAKFPCTMS